MSPRPPIVLKSRYYLDHFEEMLDFVLKGYQHVLEPSHHNFVETFRNADLDARCLYVRLVNRKGTLFWQKHLRYEEIGSIPEALIALKSIGFVREAGPEDYRDMLCLQTRATLAGLIRSTVFPDGLEVPSPSSARKGQFIDFARRSLPYGAFCEKIPASSFIAQDQLEALDYLLFLYFGQLQSGLTQFTLRDLGVMKTSSLHEEFRPRFESREEALSAFFYRRQLQSLEEIDFLDLPVLARETENWPSPVDPETEVLRGRVLHQLGLALERTGEEAMALTIHQQSGQFPSTERAVRLLMKQGDNEAAAQLLQRMIDEPSCDHELLFAEDFHARKFGQNRVGRLTQLLRDAPLLQLDESGRDYPELAVIRRYQRDGVEAFHAENAIWRQLFGLVFWELLFSGGTAAIHNAFDRRPAGLASGRFYRDNESAIQARLAEVAPLDPSPSNSGERFINSLHQTWQQYQGTPNHLVPWSEPLYHVTLKLVQHSPPSALAMVLREMAQQWNEARNGFPDLFLIEPGDPASVRFVEVKTQGDQIRRNQLAQLERLRRAGYEVEVARVEWIVDPEQDYVVVDVETTGGNAQWNRVTEIGAVKLRNGQVVEEWSSLIHPGRRIPSMITQLTGITDEMVADAPPFEDIAEEFADFVDSAVFVGHRVKFDYGFIRTEFERAGRDFRAPTLCTVVEMRRHFPGLKSYGLANLCREFDIPLESHHRALCDAKATAELLLKVNQKRQAKQTAGKSP